MLCLKEGPNQLGPIFSTLYICFVQFFLLINYSLRDPYYIRPQFFIFATPFRDSHSRPHSATHIQDSYSRPTFTTHIHDSHFTTHIRDSHFATHIRDPHSRPMFYDSTSDSLSRLPFATPLATPISDSRSRLHSRLTFATSDRAPNRDSLFLSRLPLCDSTTDGWTVLTPQRHLPSVPTLTLLKVLEPSP